MIVIVNETHRYLRERTADLHVQTEQAFAVFDLGCRPGYASFLRAQAAALMPLESWIDRADVEALIPNWPDRRRSSLLAADLATLALTVPDGPALRAVGHALGAAYVLEGSRFGGRVLLKTVSGQIDPAVAEATRFLGQVWDRQRWMELLDALSRFALDEAGRAMLLRGATTAFAHFRRSALAVAAGLSEEPRADGRPGMVHAAPQRIAVVD